MAAAQVHQDDRSGDETYSGSASSDSSFAEDDDRPCQAEPRPVGPSDPNADKLKEELQKEGLDAKGSKQETGGLSGDDNDEENDNDDDDDENGDFLASDDEDEKDDEEAYRRYEERSTFDHARIEIDENYEEDLGFPVYYAGYTNRKKQLPLGMDCWKVKTIPANAEELRIIIQDQKVRRELLAKVLDEVEKDKVRVLNAIAAGV